MAKNELEVAKNELEVSGIRIPLVGDRIDGRSVITDDPPLRLLAWVVNDWARGRFVGLLDKGVRSPDRRCLRDRGV